MKTLLALISICAFSAFAADSTIVTDLRAKMEAGDIEAQIQLARIYNRELGVIRSDFIEAERLLRPLAEKGNARAQLELGYLYDPDNGRMRNLDWSRSPKIIDSLSKELTDLVISRLFPELIQIQAADKIKKEKNNEAWISKEYSRYIVYFEPKIVGGPFLADTIQTRIRDSVELALSSEQWFLKAANQGLPEAQCALAWLMETAWASRSVHDEFYRYEKAAEEDYTYAQSYLGSYIRFRTEILQIYRVPTSG